MDRMDHTTNSPKSMQIVGRTSHSTQARVPCCRKERGADGGGGCKRIIGYRCYGAMASTGGKMRVECREGGRIVVILIQVEKDE